MSEREVEFMGKVPLPNWLDQDVSRLWTSRGESDGDLSVLLLEELLGWMTDSCAEDM